MTDRKTTKIRCCFVALIAIAAMSCSETMGGKPSARQVAVETSIRKSANFRGDALRLKLQGEYANFSKKCSDHYSLIGAVRYPRLLKDIGDKAPYEIEGASRSCPLALVSVQAEIIDGSGRSVARAAVPYEKDRSSGGTEQSCYVSVDGPGYCLAMNDNTYQLRLANEERQVGVVAIKWHN